MDMRMQGHMGRDTPACKKGQRELLVNPKGEAFGELIAFKPT